MAIDLNTLFVFALASAAIVVVPGPTVTVIIANSLRYGASAGLFTVLGTQIGLAFMLAALAFGFSSLIGSLAWLIDVVRIAGAVYLIWLGIQLWRSNGQRLLGRGEQSQQPYQAGSLIWQGFVVIWANPKALFFFGAFIPQFVDTERALLPQLLMLGFTFMLVGTLFDGAYALAAGKAGAWLNQSRLIWVERASACLLAGGGVALLSMQAG